MWSSEWDLVLTVHIATLYTEFMIFLYMYSSTISDVYKTVASEQDG